MYPTQNQSILKEKVIDTIESIKLAPIICIAGPSGSGKSTALSYLINPESNKLFSKNVGDSCQTSLIRTNLHINDSIEKGTVYVKAIKRKNPVNYQYQVQVCLQEKIYKERDELEDIEITKEDLNNIFDPIDKSYHIDNYIKRNQIELGELVDILNKLVKNIINIDGEVSLLKEAKNLLKKLRSLKKSVKLPECFKRIVEERFNKEIDLIKKIEGWFKNIEREIEQYFEKKWIIKNENIWFGSEKSDELKKLMNDIYNKDSVFHIVFEEIQYVSAPNESFKKVYDEVYGEIFPSKPLRINVLDTPGITQTGGTKKIIDNEIEKILSLPMDALLFLCKTDESNTVYDLCMESLLANSKLLFTKPVTICRTKLDVIIRNKVVNINRETTGSNNIENEIFKELCNRAYEEFLNEYIKEENLKHKENSIGDNRFKTDKSIAYLSLAPDMTEKYKTVLKDVFDEKRLFKIILDLSLAIDRKYAKDGFVKVRKRDTDQKLINVTFNNDIVESLANSICSKNEKQNIEYTNYQNEKYCFATRSINTFKDKHRNGFGHTTNAQVYDNFKLHMVPMTQRWINEFFANLNIKDYNLYTIDWNNIIFRDDKDEKIAKENMRKSGNLTFLDDITEVIHSLAMAITYTAMINDFNNCYTYNTVQYGFRSMLELFNNKLSDENYLAETIQKYLSKEIEIRLLKTCIIE